MESEVSTAAPLRDSSPPGPERDERPPGVLAAVLIAVFLHLMILWISPANFLRSTPGEPTENISLDLYLEPLEEPEVPEEQRYVQAPLDIPEHEPEDTTNFSDRSQVAAQEEAVPPDPENNPAVDGDEDDSNRIVQGNPRQDPTPPAPPATQPTTAETASPRMEAAPREQPNEVQLLAMEDPETVEEEEGERRVEEADIAEEEPEDPRDQPMVAERSPLDGAGRDRLVMPEQAAQEDQPTPRPRARVERNTSYGPLRDSSSGAIQIGRLAFDAQYSEFGEYWRRVAEIIEARWRNLVYNTRAIKFNGSRVAIRFNITRDGEVVGVEVLHSGAGRLAETISVDAIVGEAPFFKWSPEMIVLMGEQTTVQLVFIY